MHDLDEGPKACATQAEEVRRNAMTRPSDSRDYVHSRLDGKVTGPVLIEPYAIGIVSAEIIRCPDRHRFVCRHDPDQCAANPDFRRSVHVRLAAPGSAL